MLTSLAPSPMLRHMLGVRFLIMRTTWAFCIGVTRQHTTLTQCATIE